MISKLKPCPFCGKSVSMVYNSFENIFKVYHRDGNDEENCIVEGEIKIKGDSLTVAERNWNRRTYNDR